MSSLNASQLIGILFVALALAMRLANIDKRDIALMIGIGAVFELAAIAAAISHY